ncbi:hypothetical protein NM688_g5004 [Phlebia brevispora]|uniref:Uncharacterized protein n=1 Tax=Phlebia brevispora TaxID=194682 RepID=A0ACC1T1A7_9APHY|nr:hypothetical protein NM688_g5004 [Phlebia brevispora]
MPAIDANILAKHLHPLSFKLSSYDPLIKAVGNAQIVLIGDGSHGTYEFYAHRANITHRLIEEKGFTAVAVEADWPDAFRINRFPKWMWKNEVMPAFVQYLRNYNDRIIKQTGDPSKKVSFFGLDLYSLHRSAAEVLRYLERVDPAGAKAAKKQYNCFERFGEDTTRYAYEAQFGLSKVRTLVVHNYPGTHPSDQTCHNEVLRVLQQLLRNHQKYIQDEMPIGKDAYGHPREEQFMAEMNALVVRDAEEYYRLMLTEDAVTWNLRDDHFARVLVQIARHLGTTAEGVPKEAKIVVWAHNSHIGDARATDMGKKRGEINVGQRCRELFGDDNVFNIGFLTDQGTVTAAYQWDDDPHVMTMNLPLDGSLEEVLDSSISKDAFIITHQVEDNEEGEPRKVETSHELTEFLNRPRLQRFIGVLYRRNTERWSHYSKCSAADQYDAVAIVKHSRGIRPLEKEEHLHEPLGGDYDETFPFGY